MLAVPLSSVLLVPVNFFRFHSHSVICDHRYLYQSVLHLMKIRGSSGDIPFHCMRSVSVHSRLPRSIHLKVKTYCLTSEEVKFTGSNPNSCSSIFALKFTNLVG
jgi:hypothetical protein